MSSSEQLADLKILIIGGHGYIGSHLCRELDKSKIEYEICEIGLRGKPVHSRKALFFKDFLDLNLHDLEGFDCVVNLGGTSSVALAKQDSFKTLRNNVLGHQHLLTLCKLSNKRYIYASSGSVYDGSYDTEASESDPLAPSRNIYDFSKVTSDELSRINGGYWTSLRFGTVIGASPNMRHELVLNKMVKDAVLSNKIIVSNENSKRALLSISDLSKIMIEIIKNKRELHGIFNLASFNSTMLELALDVSKLTGAEVHYDRPTSTYNFTMSTQKIVDALPGLTFENLNAVISKLIDFYSLGDDYFNL